MELKNRTLSNFAELVRTGECKKFRGRLKVGVDLGTANTVLAVVDSTNRPIAGVSAPSHAIRDGVIVNYYESVQLVTKLKEELEEKLGTELLYAAAAIPPGVSEGSVKSIGYVLEGAGFEVTNIVDEPTAAAAVLKITDGAVVDVGGGTTPLIWSRDCYYAVGWSEKHGKLAQFRVDRMVAVESSDQAAVCMPDFDPAEYVRKIFGMYPDDLCTVELLCENEVMRSVIDRFGEEVGHFKAIVEVAPSPPFFAWVFTFCGKIQILGPAEVLDEMRGMAAWLQ